jgi:hypothetical protein
MPAADAVERVRVASCDGADEFFGLFPVLFEAGASGDFRHTKLLSKPAEAGSAWFVRMRQAERRFAEL